MTELEDKHQRALDEFLRIFAPANTVLECDEYFTSSEIYEKFFRLTYDKSFKKKHLLDLLETNGFKFVFFIDNFVWPMKIRASRNE